MEEMQEGSGSTIPDPKWREIADRHHSTLLADLTTAFDAQLTESVTSAVAEERRQGDQRTEAARVQTRQETLERTRRTVSDGLNQTLRLLRQVPSQAGVLKLLAEASAPWAKSALAVALEDGEARSIAGRNLNYDDLPEPVELSDAAALHSVFETTDPVSALASPAELSEPISAAFGGDTRCQIFPIAVRGTITALFIASGDLITGALELLTEAAGMRLEALAPATPPALKPLAAPGLIQIATPAPAAAPSPADNETVAAPAPTKWDDLSPADQKLHLNAQRVARVKVAEFRLYHADALRQGVFAGNIYNSLREQIDQARAHFRQNCLEKSATMVDYLHLEILRSLAHDDERLLGSEYPGPMV